MLISFFKNNLFYKKTKKYVGSETTSSKPRPKGGNSGVFLPPPPGGVKLPPPTGGVLPQTFSAPPSGNVSQPPSQSQVNNSGGHVDLLDFDFGESPSSGSVNSAPAKPVQGNSDPWGDFTGAG